MFGPVSQRLLQLTTIASVCSVSRSFTATGTAAAAAAAASFNRRPSVRSVSYSSQGSTTPTNRDMTTVLEAEATPNPGGLFLFDFDGVVCDSCDECTVSALRTCTQLGAIDDKDNIPDYPPQWLFDKMREIRPAIEVGWQIPVLLSVVLNQQYEADKKGGKAAMSVQEIITNYEQLVEEWLAKYDKTDKDMIDTFGSVRDDWIANDMNSWLDINTFYPGVAEAMSSCKGEGVLVTTKQHRFAVALCRHAGVNDEALPDDYIYGLGMYKKKADVIVDSMKAGGYAPDATHFFEDRWPTLAKCLLDDRLDGVKLHLCSWGYVTEEERKLAEAEARVEIIGLEDFERIVGSG